MSIIEEKLDFLISEINLIKKALNIVPDKFITVTDIDDSILHYTKFAKEELKINDGSIKNQKSAITNFLNHSNGVINEETVRDYLESNDSESWKSNQLKALRRYLRDYLKLGKWIESFNFTKIHTKLKTDIPNDEQLLEFFDALPYETQLVFLVLYTSGLRIGEVLQLRLCDINLETHMIDASQLHQGDTKSSWISFVTYQTMENLKRYVESSATHQDEYSKLFTLSVRSVQQTFKNASNDMNLNVHPHTLRTIFTEKCTSAGIKEKHIDAFCGRIPKSLQAKHYSDYSPQNLRKVYDLVEASLILHI